MDKASYNFKTLEEKYGSFKAPSFQITIGSTVLDTTKVLISNLNVEIDTGVAAGGCQFTVAAQYNYETSKFVNSIVPKVKVGDVLTIKAGYVVKKEIFYGFVDSCAISYASGEAPKIEITGIDAKAYLMSFRPQMYFNKKKANEVIKSVLNECLAVGYAKKVTMGMLTPFESEIIIDKIDYAAFVTEMAKLYGFQFFIVDGEIIFDNVYASDSSLITLELGTSLYGFTKICSLENQVGEVNVYSTDPSSGMPIKGTASSVTLPGSGKTAVKTADKFEKTHLDINNSFVKSEAECTKLAQSLLNARSMTYVTGSGECIGLPEIIPGRYVTIEGLDNFSSGKYFISRVVHSYGDGGYKTRFDIQGAKS